MQTKELLAQMMSFKPVSAEPDSINLLVDFIAHYSQKSKLHVAIEELDQRKILFVSTRNTKAPAVLMNAHLDVLPAPEAMFTLQEDDGYWVGRGTNDCLGNCAVIIQALLKVGAKADVGVLFSTDEEIGGRTAAHMVELGYGAKKIVLVMDGGAFALGTAQKGILALRLRAKGKAGHSSRPWESINAIDILFKVYQDIKSMFPEVKQEDQWHNTMSLNVIRAGDIFNRIPDTAEMVLDIRYTEKPDPAKMLAEIRRIPNLTVEIVTESPLMFSNPEDPALQKFHSFMESALGQTVVWQRLNGATDARHFQKLNLPIGIIGLPGSGAHSADERLQASGVPLYQQMLEQYFLTHAG